jgi:hypothetical protein
VRRGEDEDVGLEAGQCVDLHPVGSDRHADHAQAQRMRDQAGVIDG